MSATQLSHHKCLPPNGRQRASYYRYFIITLLALCLMPFKPAMAEEHVVVLVRHSEKAAEIANDPPLSAQGNMKAKALVTALDGTSFSQLIATQFKRTQQTLTPISQARHLPVTVIAAQKDLNEHIAHIVAQVHAVQGNSLIAGHSNTVPLIIKALGGPDVPAIAEDDYSQLFILSLSDEHTASLIATRYGQK